VLGLHLREDADLGGLLVDVVGDGGNARVYCYLPVREEMVGGKGE